MVKKEIHGKFEEPPWAQSEVLYEVEPDSADEEPSPQKAKPLESSKETSAIPSTSLQKDQHRDTPDKKALKGKKKKKKRKTVMSADVHAHMIVVSNNGPQVKVSRKSMATPPSSPCSSTDSGARSSVGSSSLELNAKDDSEEDKNCPISS